MDVCFIFIYHGGCVQKTKLDAALAAKCDAESNLRNLYAKSVSESDPVYVIVP